MFNLNIPPTSFLGIEGTGLCTTPKTPEIVNSLIAMSNPMDSYNFAASTVTPTNSTVSVRNFSAVSSAQSNSQDSGHSSCSASPLNSPAGMNTTPTVQQTCSQLIKAGLKLTIQSKRKLSTCDSSSGSEQPKSKYSRRDEECDESSDDDIEQKSTPKGLTPEDEDRRRRRRERNKIAATKCRMKKRERTQNLIKESEILDTQNIDLKSQARTLEMERRKLLEMLQAHIANCVSQTVVGGIPAKLLQSPAIKYLSELDLDASTPSSAVSGSGSGSGISTGIGAGTPTNGPQMSPDAMTGNKNGSNNSNNSNKALPPHRTVIPPVSTIKFPRNSGLKPAAAVTPVATPTANSPLCSVSPQQQQQQQLQQLPITHHQPQLPGGYCKPSPTSQDMGYFSSPSQENICLPPHSGTQMPQATHLTATPNHQLSDYFPHCDNSPASMRLTNEVASTIASIASIANTINTATSVGVSGGCGGGGSGSGGDNSALLAGVVVSPLTAINTPCAATTNEFVKNELVDSQSPYTTAQSAERFLFENNCDSFVDIKHAISVLPGNHSIINGVNGISCNSNNNNNNNNLLDFHTSLLGTGSNIVPFHDQISMKNDFLHDADLLGQLTGDASEFVDLDTGVTSAFMTNGGCLA